ncbi:MAG: response regulator [Myxococcales bacterium]|nr:response regulator [Myxococcales bacterium]
MMRALICRALAGAGVETFSAVDGVDALESLEGRPPPDLVVCDLHMPRMGGIELISALRTRGFTNGIILLSGEDDAGVVAQARAAGATRRLPKPFTVPDLIAAVKSEIDKQTAA